MLLITLWNYRTLQLWNAAGIGDAFVCISSHFQWKYKSFTGDDAISWNGGLQLTDGRYFIHNFKWFCTLFRRPFQTRWNEISLLEKPNGVEMWGVHLLSAQWVKPLTGPASLLQAKFSNSGHSSSTLPGKKWTFGQMFTIFIPWKKSHKCTTSSHYLDSCLDTTHFKKKQ